MQNHFFELADHLTAKLRKSEVFTCSFNGEESDFVRFNHGKYRQPGRVSQRSVTVDLIEGKRHSKARVNLSGNLAEDKARLDALLERQRGALPHLPEDPHLLYNEEVASSEHVSDNLLPEAGEATGAVVKAAENLDLVGIYAAGPIHCGFASSLGQRNWFSSYSFNFDFSLYHAGDKAVKADYAGFAWDDADFTGRIAAAEEQLAALSRPARTIDPGKYRVYLTPTALQEIVDLLTWGGFGLEAHRTKRTPFLHMVEGDKRLNERVSFTENTAEGTAPNFQSAGFLKPPRVSLVDRGSYNGCLVSPRSAKEYGVPTNGAGAWESPESMEMSAGALPRERALEELGTGIRISNLWYLNYSDRAAGRMTGMTRFATFWVENGRIENPLNVMRFDESIYRMLGDKLIDLTAERDFLLSSSTYGGRSTSSARLPGALIDELSFTL